MAELRATLSFPTRRGKKGFKLKDSVGKRAKAE